MTPTPIKRNNKELFPQLDIGVTDWIRIRIKQRVRPSCQAWTAARRQVAARQTPWIASSHLTLPPSLPTTAVLQTRRYRFVEPSPRQTNERNHVGGYVPQYLGLRRLLVLFRDVVIPSEWEYYKPIDMITIHRHCPFVAGRRWLLLVPCLARRVASLFVW